MAVVNKRLVVRRPVIRVKQSHIKRGICDNVENCAVALAVQEHFTQRGLPVETVIVEGSEIRVVLDDLVFDMSKKVITFIEKFDEDKNSVKPMTFQLEPLYAN